MALTLGALVAELGGELHGGAATCIEGIAPLESAGPQQISFLSHPKYLPQLAHSRAGCVIVAPEQADAAKTRGACIVTPHPYLYFARLTQLWKRHQRAPQPVRVHRSAVIDPEAVLAEDVEIGAHCVVERGARIGAGTRLRSRVVVSEGCEIGARCLLHPGVVIGADGFGFAPAPDGSWVKIEQLGSVRIGDDVEIGANSCVDRGALEDTVIEHGVKIDNLVQVGHNVRIGAHTALAGCVGVAGSARIGAHCTIGGGAVVLGHLTLVDGVHVSAASVVTRSILKPGHYSGFFPIDDNADWEKNAVALRQLYRLRERLRALERSPRSP
ncbi:MAG: UDP-3-O-(3-hydroxymyristoyl)glucosamine N-acyltransferase [Tibeticola sp.]